MSCRLEPITSANLILYGTICGQKGSTTKSFLPCLAEFARSDRGMKCSEAFVGLDLLEKDGSIKICSTLVNFKKIKKFFSCNQFY